MQATNGFMYGLINAQKNLNETQRYKDSICLDSGSSLDLFCNKDLVYDCKDTDLTLMLETNAGMSRSNKLAKVPGRKNPVRFDN